jgi:hypothetical protein
MKSIISVIFAINGSVLSILSGTINFCMRTDFLSVMCAMLSSLGQRILLYIHAYNVQTSNATPAVSHLTTNCNPLEKNVFVVRYALRNFQTRVIYFNITVFIRENTVTRRKANHSSVTCVVSSSQVQVLSDDIPIYIVEGNYSIELVEIFVMSNKANFSSHNCMLYLM